jgi:hypothetical protein
MRVFLVPEVAFDDIPVHFVHLHDLVLLTEQVIGGPWGLFYYYLLVHAALLV